MSNTEKNLIEELTQVMELLRKRSRLSILDGWQRQNKQGDWQTLEVVNSKRNQPMVAFDQGEENIHLRQIWQVPESYARLPVFDSIVRLNLIWWADICEVWINGIKVQEGDLFDQKCRIILPIYQNALGFAQSILIEIKLNSPKHDIGAVQLSEIVFEHIHQPSDPEQFSTELEILQTYIPIFNAQNIDIQPIQTAASQIQTLLIEPESAFSFFTTLAEIRQTLLHYVEFLKQRQIYILGNSHIDVAWLWAIAETKKAMSRTFRSALNLQKKYPELIFNQSTAVSYQWMEQEDPELFAQIQIAVAEGKWELIGGTWVEPDGNLPSGESLIRQILYGQEYFQQKFNRTVKIAWLPDTFGFHWQMPQIFLKSGFEAFVTQKLLWNDTNKFPHQIFWWEGVDGSRIFTYFSNEIGQGLEPSAIAKYLSKQEEKHGITETVWLYGVGDHGGGPTADMLDMGRKWAESELFFKMEPSTLESFLINLKKNQDFDGAAPQGHQNLTAQPLPIWKDELYLEFHRGTLTTKADQKRQNRQIEVLLGNAEKYSAIASLIADTPYPQNQLESAWQGLLLNQFHDILTGTSIPEVFVDADLTWTGVREICDLLLSVETDESNSLQAWNFLNWERSQLVELADNSLYWLENVPSFGFAEINPAVAQCKEPVSITSDQNKYYLDNKFLRVEIRRDSGAIAQIFDKRSQQAVMNSASELQFFEDKGQYWDAWNIDPDYESKQLESTTLESIEIKEALGLRASLTIVSKFRNSTFTQEIQLSAFEAFITVKNSVDWQEDYTLVKVAFSVNWRSPFATYEIPMGTIQRSTLAETPEAKAKWEVPAQYWADIASDQIGLAVLNDSKYGYDAKPDCLRLTLLRSPSWPTPNSDRGFHEFTYRLVPHQGDWREANIVQLAQELNNPLVLKKSSIPASVKSASQSFLQVSASNIILSAFKRSQDSSGWIMRFYEAHGQETETIFKILPDILSIKSVHHCNLLETLENPIQVTANEFVCTFQPYEIKTFYIN
ncbi:MAG: alpha-mannosidase [Oscillatoriales cyanobacterium CG2_30_44_21]|nr:MAG: alpha-mannosidase [Oscillatoriales cyanobacterium CG2_30_44_21]